MNHTIMWSRRNTGYIKGVNMKIFWMLLIAMFLGACSSVKVPSEPNIKIKDGSGKDIAVVTQDGNLTYLNGGNDQNVIVTLINQIQQLVANHNQTLKDLQLLLPAQMKKASELEAKRQKDEAAKAAK